METTTTISAAMHAALLDAFGYECFRPQQEAAVTAAMAGRDVLVVMPTGAGKSLCFQLPAALSDGVTLVVSPLVALMRDQVEALNQRPAFAAIGCAYLNSSQTMPEQREVLAKLRGNNLKMLYVAPERFRSPAFRDALQQARIVRFVIDEAHCISEWGHDFRPDYLMMAQIIESVGRPPVMAVTATATKRVQQAIVDTLGMRDPVRLVGGFNRANLHLSVVKCESEHQRLQLIERALPKLAAAGGSGLVYAATHKSCEEVAAVADVALSAIGQRAAAYHAGMDTETRNELQRAWMAGEIQVLVATNAFGMGIDKADVRFVIHYMYPGSIESYYQEAGRAGRDGQDAQCIILYHYSDRRVREWFIDNDDLKAVDYQTAHSRLCGQSPDDMATLSANWWMDSLGWDSTKVRRVLGELERAGLVQRLEENADGMVVRVLDHEFPDALFERLAQGLAKQAQERHRRLGEMVDYCKTYHCRRHTTLAYFGDEERVFQPHCCDNCERPKAIPAPAPADEFVQAMPEAVGDIYALLQGLDALRPALGKPRMVKLLRGADSADMHKYRGCPLYGSLATASPAGIEALIGALVQRGLLKVDTEDEYFVCRVTGAGRTAWQMRERLQIALPGPSRVGRTSSADILEALKAWRTMQAKLDKKPAYLVMGDRVLEHVAKKRPRDAETLAATPGVTTEDAARYAETLLPILMG